VSGPSAVMVVLVLARGLIGWCLSSGCWGLGLRGRDYGA